jgi:hypothetical protein
VDGLSKRRINTKQVEWECKCITLSKLKQGKYSVDTYNNIFNNYGADANFDNEALHFMYMQGLNNNIHSQIMLMSVVPTTLQEMQDKASEFDIRCNYNNSKVLDSYACCSTTTTMSLDLVPILSVRRPDGDLGYTLGV